MNHAFAPITLGASLRQLRLDGFRLTESIHEPGVRLALHEHELASLAIVLEGSFHEIYRGGPRLCLARSVVLKAPGTAHANAFGESGSRTLLVELLPEALETIPMRLGAQPLLARRRGWRTLERAIGSFYAGAADALSLESLLLELLTDLGAIEMACAGRSCVNRAIDLLHQEFRQPLRLRALAEAVGVHPVSLSRAFRMELGCTPGDVLRGIRVEWAAHLLEATDLPLAMVASDAGFYDQSHLTQALRRATGMTPMHWRTARRRRVVGRS